MSSHVLLYPCTFEETFCRIALEAMAYRTVIITSKLSALPETIKSGFFIDNVVGSKEWKIDVLKCIDVVFDKENIYEIENMLDNNELYVKEEKNYKKIVNEFYNNYIK